MKFGGEVECVIRTNCLDFVEVPNPGVWTVKGGLDKVSPQGGVRLCVCVCFVRAARMSCQNPRLMPQGGSPW